MTQKKASAPPWPLRLGHKLFSVAPYRTTLVVASSLTSQVGLLLAFLLPLKIVMLLGAKGVPNYMPPPFGTLTHDNLIIVLSVLALTFYVLHLLANKVSEQASKAGARKLLETSRKIVLFENQDTLATTAYRKYSEALSGLTFTVMALGVLGWLYDDVAVTIFLLAATTAAGAAIAAKASHALHNKLKTNAPAYVNAATGVGFLAIFVFIVIDFLALSPPNFIIALISIILSRQLMSQAGLAARNMAFLSQQKNKISALFFHNSTFDHSQQAITGGVWRILEKKRRDVWICELLARNTSLPTKNFIARWMQTNMPDIIAIELTWPDNDRTLVIKVFDKNKTASALHEATLLLDQPEALPAPPLICIDTCSEGFHCHIFDTSGLLPYEGKTPSALSRDLTAQLLDEQPSKDLIERYTRSRKMVWERLDQTLLTRLRVVAEPEDNRRLDHFESFVPKIQAAVKRLPLRFHTPIPPINGLLYQDDRGMPLTVHWEKWGLVPQGAGWPIKSPDDLVDLSNALRNIDSADERLAANEIAACLHQLLTHSDRQKYRTALDTLALTDDSISRINGRR